MLLLFLSSVLAGMVIGAPVGVAGALVTDAALAHNLKRLRLTILAAASGDMVVALATSFAAKPIRNYVQGHIFSFQLCAGIAILTLAVLLWHSAAKSTRSVIDKSEIHGSSKWLIGHTAPALAAFLITVFHPGSILSVLGVVAIISGTLSTSWLHKLIFTAGIACGSGLVFSFSGFLFWKIRKKADNYVHYLRYGLALMVASLGFYLILSTILK